MANFAKFRSVILPLTAITGTAALVYCYKIDKRKVLNETAKVEVEDEVQKMYKIHQHNREWNNDWDQRENSEGGKTRHILLVRHGQYYNEGKESEKILTQKGVQQATCTGLRLVKLGLPYTDFLISTMTRAQQTGRIILNVFEDASLQVKVTNTFLLKEGCPHPGSPATKLQYRVEDGKRLDCAFKLFFHRADPKQIQDSCTVLVCHSNVIRYFVCRALQLPEEAWTRLALNHSSITWLSIEADGKVILRAFGESGHMPQDLITEFSERRAYDI